MSQAVLNHVGVHIFSEFELNIAKRVSPRASDPPRWPTHIALSEMASLLLTTNHRDPGRRIPDTEGAQTQYHRSL